MPLELIKTPSETIFVDVVGTFGATFSAEQTKTPVEDGSLRSDHKVLAPPVLQIEVKQTETPIEDPEYEFKSLNVEYPKISTGGEKTLEVEVPKVRTKVLSPFLLAGQAVTAGISAIASALGKADGSVIKLTYEELTGVTFDSFDTETYQASSPKDRGGELADKLQALYAGDELASVTYRGRTYPEMSLVGMTISYAPGEAGLSTFALTFERLRTAVIDRVVLPNPEDLAHAATKELGKKGAGAKAKKVSEKKGEQVSALKSIFG